MFYPIILKYWSFILSNSFQWLKDNGILTSQMSARVWVWVFFSQLLIEFFLQHTKSNFFIASTFSINDLFRSKTVSTLSILAASCGKASAYTIAVSFIYFKISPQVGKQGRCYMSFMHTFVLIGALCFKHKIVFHRFVKIFEGLEDKPILLSIFNSSISQLRALAFESSENILNIYLG